MDNVIRRCRMAIGVAVAAGAASLGCASPPSAPPVRPPVEPAASQPAAAPLTAGPVGKYQLVAGPYWLSPNVNHDEAGHQTVYLLDTQTGQVWRCQRIVATNNEGTAVREYWDWEPVPKAELPASKTAGQD